MVPRGIKGAKEEKPILKSMYRNITAEFEITFIVGIIQATADFVQFSKLRIISVLIGGLHAPCVEISPHGTEELGSSGFGNQLNDAAGCLAILRFETTGLDLYFLDEGQVQAAAERSINSRPHANAAESGVIDRDAVCDIKIFKSRRARDRRILNSRPTARCHAWR